MHGFVQRERTRHADDKDAYRQIDPQGDLPLGAVMSGALEAGLRMFGVVFPDGSYRDIGVPGNLIDAMRFSGDSF
jgi:hypothetical protein